MKCVEICPYHELKIEWNDDRICHEYISICKQTQQEMARQAYNEHDINAECPVPLHVVAAEVARQQECLAVMARIIAYEITEQAAAESASTPRQAKKGGFLNAEVETNSRSTEIEPDRRVCHDPNRSFVPESHRKRGVAMPARMETPACRSVRGGRGRPV